MPPLNLTSEEAALLREILESTLADLRMEIVDTDRSNYKESLKEKKELLAKVVEKMRTIQSDD